MPPFQKESNSFSNKIKVMGAGGKKKKGKQEK